MSVDARTPVDQEWPDEDLESVSVCPVCTSPRRRTLYEGLCDSLFDTPGRWTLHGCLSCRSAYLDPRPTRHSMARAYERYPTHDHTESREHTAGRSFRRAFANGYLNQRFGTDYQLASRLGGSLTQFVPWKRHQLDAIGRHLPRGGAGRRLLDVGCGNGDFLDLAQRAGWQVMGVEPDPTAAQVARSRGLDVRVGSIDSLGSLANVFDAITLGHVIEHVHDPVSLLARCRMLLRPNGWVWIDTPNLRSFGHRRYGRSWRGLEPPRHLVLFTMSSLTQALTRGGFEGVELAPWRPVATWLYPASEVAGSSRDDPEGTSLILRARIRGLLGDLRAWRQEEGREFLTVTARRAGE